MLTLHGVMEKYMKEALREAELAASKGEVPIGAVIIYEGVIVGRGGNRTESLNDPTAHAEIIAIRQAADTLGGWRLSECDIYVTVEPCSMCAGAIVLARIRNLYIGTADTKSGACGSVFNIPQEGRLNHCVRIEKGVMEDECRCLIKDFFKRLRRDKSEEN